MTDGSVLLSAHFDAIIIGTGQAGPALAARLVGAGINVAVVERHQFGGTCVNTGCTPTKTLIASARVAYVARRAASFGVDIGGAVSVDMVRVTARKDNVAGRSSSGVEAWMRGLETCTVYQGHATLEGSDKVRVGAECVSVDTDATGIEIGIEIGIDCESGDRVANGSHLLLAVGRIPNTADLGLDAAGVEVNNGGYITVDDQLRTNAAGIWALGDCNGQGAFTHTSYNDYEIVAANLLDDDPRRVTDRYPCYGLFIDPPLGRVGMTEAQAKTSGRNVLVAKRPMTHVARAVERSETHGFMKIAVDADSKEILGAAILGVGGDEAIHSIADIMYAKAPYTVIQRALHIHPTVSELIPTMLGDLEPLV